MAECVHMLHLVPVWQSEERHRKLKIMMQDRPDLIQSELAGLAFDSLQQVFRKADIKIAMAIQPMAFEHNNTIFVLIDPAAGGPQSDYAVVSLCRSRGNVTVSVCVLRVLRVLRIVPRVHACVNKEDFGCGLLGHVLGDDLVAQVHSKVANLALRAFRLTLEHLLLESDVQVENNEKEREKCSV